MTIILSIRRLAIVSFVFVLSLGILAPVATAQSDPNPISNFPVDVSVSSTSAPADGTAKISINLFIYGYKCNGQDGLQETASCSNGTQSTEKVALSNRWIGVYISGTGNTYYDLNTPAGVQYVTSGTDGRASFQMSSVVAETKKLQFCDHVKGVPPEAATSQFVTFTEPPRKATTNSASSIAEPFVTSVEIDNHSVDTRQITTLNTTQRITLKGTANPGSTVVFSVNTDPILSASTIVSSEGTWTYRFEEFNKGTYSIEGYTAMPNKKITSSQVSLLSFSVADPAKTGSTTNDIQRKDNKKTSYLLGSSLALLIVCLIALFAYRKRQNRASIRQRNNQS